jgi:RNA polymerase sigma-70 factor (ECF subfamily)
MSVLAYIRAIVRDYELAEDIFQEVSIIALAKSDSIQDEKHFAGWIRQVARLESLTALRKQGKLPQPLSEVTLDLLDANWDETAQSGRADRIEALRLCLEELTPRSQKIVQLRYGHGMKGAELAEVLQRPLNTIYVAVYRIHRTLAECVRKRVDVGGAGNA